MVKVEWNINKSIGSKTIRNTIITIVIVACMLISYSLITGKPIDRIFVSTQAKIDTIKKYNSTTQNNVENMNGDIVNGDKIIYNK